MAALHGLAAAVYLPCGRFDLALAAGKAADALDACQRLLAVEPWHEGAALLGMRACVALGDVAAARRLYNKLAQTLRADLNAEPSPRSRPITTS